MRRTGLAAVLVLAVTAVGCDPGDDETTPGKETHGTSPTATAEPTPDLDTAIDDLTKDALAVDLEAEVVGTGSGPESFAETLYYEDLIDFGRGVIFMPASLTIRYPSLTHEEHAKKLLRMFKQNGFGTGLTYDVDDFASGFVQKSDELRCRLLRGPAAAWLRCIPMDLFYFMETDVVGAIMPVYFEETGDLDNGCWEVTYPHAYGVEAPVAAFLRTGACQGPDEYRAYLNDGDGWNRVAKAASYRAIGGALGKTVCVPETRSNFANLCSSGSA